MTIETQDGFRPFSEFVTEVNKGRVHDTLTVELHDLVNAVREHGKKGTLTLSIVVAPLAKGDDSQFTVTAVVKANAPKAEPRPSIYFADRAGRLVTNDPNALTLPLAELPERPEPRSI